MSARREDYIAVGQILQEQTADLGMSLTENRPLTTFVLPRTTTLAEQSESSSGGGPCQRRTPGYPAETAACPLAVLAA